MKGRAETETGKYLLFRAGGTFALHLSAVREILPYAALTRPPMTASFVAGTINVGGQAIVVLNLGALLGCDMDAPDLQSHMIHLADPSFPMALLVERTLTTIGVGAVSVSEVPEAASFNGLVAAELRRGDEPVAYLLNADALLTEEESRRIAEFSVRAQARLDGLEVA